MKDCSSLRGHDPGTGCWGLAQLAIAAFLTWIAGFVDAVGFLSFARIYTANMSGNTVALGISLYQLEPGTALIRLWPILLYVFGLVLGRSLIEIGARLGTRRIASVAFACEVLLLGIASLLRTTPAHSMNAWQYLAIALLATAMGIQNSTLTRFSSVTLHTGFVTGTLVKFSEHFVAYAAFLCDKVRSGSAFTKALAGSAGQSSRRLALFLALTWMAYVFGAALGAWGKSIARSEALICPIIGLALLIAVDLYKPLATQEEQQQAQLE